jgi:hypothetical protein
MKSSPFGFQSVKDIALAATDAARAQRFYSETFQLEEDRESTEEVGYRIGGSVWISANILRPTIQIRASPCKYKTLERPENAY